ncbi:MAG: J domain-containing protein, partial [Enterovibrio sp.]
FVTQIETLLNTQLNENMTFEQVLVPSAPNSISGDAMLAQLAELTPEERALFLLRLSRATLIICQLITCELAQIRQGAEMILPADASTDTAPEPPSSTDSESEDESPLPSTGFISLANGETEEQPLSRRSSTAETPTRTTPEPPSPEHDDSEEDEPAAQSVGALQIANVEEIECEGWQGPQELTPIANLEERSHRPNAAEASLEDAPAEGVSGSSTSTPASTVPKANIFERVYTAVFKKGDTGGPMDVQKCRKKIADANKSDGLVAKLRLMSFIAHNFSANAMEEAEDQKTLIKAKELLVKLNSYMPAVLQENQTELVEQFRLIFATTLNAQLMQEMNKNNSVQSRPVTLSSHLIYYNMIYAYLEDLPLPWDHDAVYQSIRDLTYSVKDEKSGITIPLKDFKLADVPLNTKIKLPHSYCFAALGLPPDATEAQVREAYKTLRFKYHPDKNLEDQAKAQEMFLRLQIVAKSLKL